MGFLTFRGFPLVTAGRTSRHALPLLSFHVYKSIALNRDAEAALLKDSPHPSSGPKAIVELRAAVSSVRQHVTTPKRATVSRRGRPHRSALDTRRTTHPLGCTTFTYGLPKHPAGEPPHMDWTLSTPKRLRVRESCGTDAETPLPTAPHHGPRAPSCEMQSELCNHPMPLIAGWMLN